VGFLVRIELAKESKISEETISSVEATVREIRHKSRKAWTGFTVRHAPDYARKKYSAEEKVRTPALACWCKCPSGCVSNGGKRILPHFM
jgi:hypothetical protein